MNEPLNSGDFSVSQNRVRVSSFNERSLSYFSPSNNFGSTRNSRISVESIGSYDDSKVIWQEDVYKYALASEKLEKIARVVDLGCGSGKKSMTLTPTTIKLTLVDFQDLTLSNGRSHDFVKCDFSNLYDLENLETILSSSEPTIYILSDVIEHLIDPRPILRVLRKLLRQNDQNRLILSTPNADKTFPLNHPGPPENERHVREWSDLEIVKSIKSSGFQIEDVQSVKQNKFDDFNKTTVLEVSCTNSSYLSFLQSNGISGFIQHLVITTEHARTGKSGGIGSYLDYLTKNSNLDLLILFCGDLGIEENPIQFCQNYGWIHTRQLVQRDNWPSWDQLDNEEILDATLQIIFLVDTIKLIEYQDYLGIGYRIAQASRTSLLPNDVRTICYCHGSNFYLDNGFKTPSIERANFVDMRERISIEDSDYVMFPSEFLRSLYKDSQGLKMRETFLSPYPINLKKLENLSIEYQYLDTIIFYGKDNAHKGFPIFLRALANVAIDAPEILGRIKKVILAGVELQSVPPELKSVFNFEVFRGSREGALELLKSNCLRSVVVLPYVADNQPIAIFEVIESGSRLISFNAGGIPEQIQSDFDDHILADADPKKLLRLLVECFNESSWTRWSYISQLHTIVSQNLERHTNSYVTLFASLLNPSEKVEKKHAIYSTTAAMLVSTLDDLEYRLNNVLSSTSEFDEILVVSTFDLEHIIKEKLKFNPDGMIRLATLNSASMDWKQELLKDINTDFVVFLEPSHRITNDYLAACRSGVMKNDEIACLIPFSYSTQIGGDHKSISIEAFETQTGVDLVSLFQAEVVSQTGIYWRVSCLKSLTEIPANLNPNWRLRFILSKLIIAGKRVQVIPKRLAFSTNDLHLTPVDTVNEFEAWNTFLELLNFPNNEKYGFVRLLFSSSMNSPINFKNSDLASFHNYDKSSLINTIHQLKTEIDLILKSRTWRYTRTIRKVVSQFRRVLHLR